MNVCIIEKYGELFKISNEGHLFKRLEINNEDVRPCLENLLNSKILSYKEYGITSYCGNIFHLFVVSLDKKDDSNYLTLNEIKKLEVEDMLDYAALHKYLHVHNLDEIDSLTGLFNQNAFFEYLSKISVDDGKIIYIFTIDANGLKILNDKYGYEAGNELLKGCGQIISKVFKGVGKCFRKGGDEFSAIVISDGIDPEEYYSKLKEEAHKFNGKYVSDMSISVGYSTSIEANTYDAITISNLADTSMRANKEEYYNIKFKIDDKYVPGSNEGRFYKLIHETFELLPVGICIVDMYPNYSYIRFNTPFMNFFGYKKAESFSKVSFKDLLMKQGIKLDKFDQNHRQKEYVIKGHKLNIFYCNHREYGETLFVSLYI